MENFKVTNLNEAHTSVLELIKDFEANEIHYLSSVYQEAEVRKEFIDKFWTAMGWDVNHNLQKNPFQQEVKIEKGQRQNGGVGQKRADYAFYLAPDFKKVQFFIEAKKPSRTLKENKEDYFQTAKYGWNAGTGVSVLTDFQELVIVDCRFMPDFDTILSNKIKYYSYKQFKDIEVFSEVYWLFSREAVEAGNLKTYVEELPKPKSGASKQFKMFGGGQSIDDTFLTYIDTIRLEIAQAFYNNEKTLDKFDLTEATQRTIDRIVFIRFLEDKMIEPFNILQQVATHPHPWQKFISECKRLDAKYNGIVFKHIFIDKDDFLGADEGIFRNICLELDHTNTPYDFNYIPIHILGNIYERFLGKIIEVENGVCRIELKPEVRKAGGIFYTPKYVVDYIVKETIGKQIVGKSPKEISKMTFADISCGSGSFLIGIFDYLLDYHRNYYNENQTEAKKAGCKFDNESGKWVLSIHQKQQILLNNVYGVDIDLQATEVTQLSLFLKMLEDETTASANDMLVLFSDKILPDLTNNIKWGNSLIGYEIVDEILDFDKEERRKLNPFDYNSGFPKVFANGGFTAIIGNPPYVKEYTSKESFEWVKKGKLSKYYQGKMDLWYFFACYGIDLLSQNGLLGYIIPNNWTSNSGASILRNKIINDSKVLELVDFGSYMVFKDASIQTMIMIVQKNNKSDNYTFNNQVYHVKKSNEEAINNDLLNKTSIVSSIISPTIEKKKYVNKFLKFDDDSVADILDKIFSKINFTLDAKKEVAQGIVTPQNELNEKNATILGYGYQKNEGIFILTNEEVKSKGFDKQELKLIKPLYTSNQLGKYSVVGDNLFQIIYTDSSFKNVSKIESFPNIKNHLDRYKSIITSDNKPYGLHRARNEEFFKGEKILSLRKCTSPTFTFSDEDCYVLQSYNIIKSKRIDLKYLTGLLNSSLISFWLFKKGKMQGEIYQVDKEPLLDIPIHLPTSKTQIQEVSELVEKIIKLKQKLQSTTGHDLEFLKNYIVSYEKKIDDIIYKIYDITNEEQSKITLTLENYHE
jgi:adenine-specific DNA-methyltransferase